MWHIVAIQCQKIFCNKGKVYMFSVFLGTCALVALTALILLIFKLRTASLEREVKEEPVL